MGKVLVIGALGAVAIVVRKLFGLARDRASDPQPALARERE
jgi:cobalamin biosynthesis protein CbiG